MQSSATKVSELKVLVTGAQGVVGTPLCERLQSSELTFMSVSRSPKALENSLQWDLNLPPSEEVQSLINDMTVLIHCAPIWLLPAHLETLSKTHIKRLVVFSSTSVISKVNSTNPQEQALVKKLAQSEEQLFGYCLQHKINLTVLRPSLIYGYGRDQNISHIASFIRKWGFMLLVGQACGKRQPVHADDLVDASLAIIDNELTYAKAYNLAGANVISYKAMVTKIFLGLDKAPKIISLPLAPFRFLLVLASKLTAFSYTPEMADRMNQDLEYDFTPAARDFAYAPQGFLEQPGRDLPH